MIYRKIELNSKETRCHKTENIRQALDLEFLENVLVQKYVDLNQRTVDKEKDVAKAEETSDDEDGDGDDKDDQDAAFEDARRRSLLENYGVEGEPSRAATTTELATT